MLETQLDGSCFLAFGIIGIVSALLLHKDKLRLSSALLPTFGSKRKRRSVAVRSQEFSRLIFLTARKKTFVLLLRKKGKQRGDRLQPPQPPNPRALFRKSKWVNIKVGRREEEPLGVVGFLLYSLNYTMRTRRRLLAYRWWIYLLRQYSVPLTGSSRNRRIKIYI